jgi:hypothetical protein
MYDSETVKVGKNILSSGRGSAVARKVSKVLPAHTWWRAAVQIPLDSNLSAARVLWGSAIWCQNPVQEASDEPGRGRETTAIAIWILEGQDSEASL